MAKSKKTSKNKDLDDDTSNILIAKKDFVICHNEFFREIKIGEDISDVPDIFLDNLKTEGVI